MQQRQQTSGSRSDELIEGRYAVDAARRLPEAGAGLAAFAAHEAGSARAGLMAVQVRPRAPPRARPLSVLPGTVIPGLLGTYAHGVGVGPGGVADVFVVCDAPPGPPVGTREAIGRRWGEGELLACVLRPIGAVLLGLQRLRLTHRAIRPDNVFQARAGQGVLLGPAWASPPAALQPPSFEPPYVAACLPAGRGDGGIADDVYALGVLLLSLAAGQVPLAGLDEAEVLRRKRALGSFAALSAGLTVSPVMAELVRGMLADDPDHRPAPVHLQDPEAIRGRRIATRPARIATRPLEVSGHSVWHARGLAAALAGSPDTGVRALQGGAVDRWLRRHLGEPALASQIEDAVRGRAADAGADDTADSLLLVRAIGLLDPLAPLCWGGLRLWPDGLGPALAAATPAEAESLARLIESEAVAVWAAARPGRCDVASLRAQARDWRMMLARRDWAGGLAVLAVQLNPLERCASPALGARPVVGAPDLLPALERVALARAASPALPIDREIAAFIAGQDAFRLAREVASLGAAPEIAALSQLRLLARLQTRLRAPALPALTGWLAAALRPSLAGWRGVARRARVEAAMARQAEAGTLAGLLQAVEDSAERETDEREAEAARAAIAGIDAELARIASGRGERMTRARKAGLEVTAALGVIAIAVVAAVLVL